MSEWRDFMRENNEGIRAGMIAQYRRNEQAEIDAGHPAAAAEWARAVGWLTEPDGLDAALEYFGYSRNGPNRP